MEQSNAKKYLEIATNVAVLLVAVTFLSILAWNYFARQTQPRLQTGLQRDQILPQAHGISYSDSPQTLLIAINTNCAYCTQSVSFYNRLVNIQRGRTETTRIIAIFPNSEEDVRQYVQRERLNVDAVAAVDFRSLNVAGTPTVILVDRSGRVLDFWIGMLPTVAENQVIESISPSDNHAM